MAITVKHKFVSAIADESDASVVRPSNWNDTHDIVGLGTAAALDAGVANGVATLDANGTVPTSQLPSLSGSYVPYTGATGAVDLNAKTLVNVSNLGVNTTTVPTIKIRAVGDNNSGSRIAMRGYSSDANSSAIRVSKFRGTVAAPQAPISGDSLGKFELAGYGTTSADAYPQVSLEGVTTEVWGATARGAKAVVKVTPNTTTTQVTAITIDQDSKATFAGAITTTGLTNSGLTSGRVTYAGTGGLLTDTSTFVFDGTNLGVGTTTPTTYGNVAVIGNGVTSTVFIGTSSNAAPFAAGILKFGSTSNANAYINYGGQIASYSIGGVDQYDLRFYTSNGTPSVERMRVFYSGGVSIGNTTDAGAGNLSVTGTITSAQGVTGNALYATDGVTNARIIPSGGISYWGNTSNHPVYFQTNNAVRLAISETGGVSIGNTTDAGATNLSVTGNTKSGSFQTTNGSVAAAVATPTTLFTMANRGTYIITAMIVYSTAPDAYVATATASWDGSGGKIVSDNGTNVVLTLSGANVQVTVTSYATQTIYWSYLYIAL